MDHHKKLEIIPWISTIIKKIINIDLYDNTTINATKILTFHTLYQRFFYALE
ncbi:hypothetical protein [Ehrlichia chaffeensis]|uniref:hypothetical protein n=1 Tax=Ehrlichia chaffeensis TaxID=945 RepID=UPI00139177D4|nr:hypothetical protein [Ehrlichia chaffeensis]